MALSEKQLAECLGEAGRFLQAFRPREEIRDKLDYRFKIKRSEIVLYSIRPRWDGSPGVSEQELAKVKWVAAREKWQIYWMRADCRWHEYKAIREIRSLKDALAEVRADPYGCFFG